MRCPVRGRPTAGRSILAADLPPRSAFHYGMTATRAVRKKGSGRSVSRGRLQDDVEIREAERPGQTVPGRLLRVIDEGEFLDQALLDREHRVRFDVRAARHENVRGQRPVPGS